MLLAQLHEQEIRRAIGTPGDGTLEVEGVATIDAVVDRCLCFLDRDGTPAIREGFAARTGCIAIVRHGSPLVAEPGANRVLETTHPRAALAKVLDFIRTERRQPPWIEVRSIALSASISRLAFVDGTVDIGEGVVVEAFCTVGPDVRIGPRTVLHAGTRIYPRVSIGEDSVIGANSVIGSEGYGFVRDDFGDKMRIPHLAGVIIGSHVEIGALSVVQYGTIAPTVIEDHCKIDDNVEVGHNAHVGRGSSITGGVVIGGSARIGAEAWVGINSSIRNGRSVGRGALVGMHVSVQADLADHAVARAPRPDIRGRNHIDSTTIGFTD